MDVDHPIPQPRIDLSAECKFTGGLKKPVPLPRQNIGNMQRQEENKFNLTLDVPKDNQLDESNKSICNVNTLKKSLNDSIQRTSKSVVGTTRKASLRLESSVRNIISKRRTIPPSTDNNCDIGLDIKNIRSLSLPSEDIFQSISFHSPIQIYNDKDSDQVECTDAESDVYGVPPPLYPPPPLPDESVYDEIQSINSGHSSSCNDPYCSSTSGSCQESDAVIYEDVPIKMCISHSASSSSDKTSDCSSLSHSIGFKEKVIPIPSNVSRSNSWSFYDTTNEDIYSNLNDIDNISELDDICSLSSTNIYTRNSGSPADQSISYGSGSPSLLGELEALKCNSSDDESFYSVSSQGRFSVQNELYEQWDLKLRHSVPDIQQSESVKRPAMASKSVIYEFDPLYENSELDTVSSLDSDKLRFAELLNMSNNVTRSPYGKINRISLTKQNVANQVGLLDKSPVAPPVPPRRYDYIEPEENMTKSETVSLDSQSVSALEDSSCSESSAISDEKTNNAEVLEQKSLSCTVPENVSTVSPASVGSVQGKRRITRWQSVKHAIQLVTDNSSWSPVLLRRTRSTNGEKSPVHSDGTVFYDKENKQAHKEHPGISSHKLIPYTGVLFRVVSSSDVGKRWCVLAEGKFTCFQDKTGTNIKEVIALDNVLSISVSSDFKIRQSDSSRNKPPNSDTDVFHCFILNVTDRVQNYVFGATCTIERRVWMQKIMENLSKNFPLRILSDFTRGGWCYLKEGISGAWNSAWIVLHKRTLFYYPTEGVLEEADLRKVMCTALLENDDECTCPHVKHKGPTLVIDFPGQTLYLQMDTATETAEWRTAIKSAAVNNGTNLGQQQLSKDDVPVIVDKCVNFIYAQGSMSEGIYRRSGTNSNVTRLLTLFREDAWAVQLTRKDYSEYDVASVLKRFFRDLPEPLFTTELHSQLCEVAEGKCGTHVNDRITNYRKILEQLPPVNYLTARKILGHLYFIHEQHEKNLMPVENLSAIWGPTLMHIEGDEYQMFAEQEAAVIVDLINMFPKLFDVDPDEITREKRMLEVLERYHSGNSQPTKSKPSGDLKIWIHLENKDSGNCINVTVGPQKLAGEICKELASKTCHPHHELILEEVVLNGALVRPLHHTEKVLDVVLRWGYWQDIDRKDNCLVLRKDDILKEVAPLVKPLVPMCGELRFADQKTKSFKNYMFEFSQAKLCYYRDKRGSVKLNDWKIEDIVWYLGYEPKRNPQTRWAITFIDKNGKVKRSKENPFFGCTIAGSSKEEQLRWIGAMLIGEYPQGILPSPTFIE